MSGYCPEGLGTCPDAESGPCVVGHPCALHPATPSDALSTSEPVAQTRGGTPTHPHTREPLRAFVWPCEKRTAHEPHGDCPGVKAHPRTMIGGGYRAVETEENQDAD